MSERTREVLWAVIGAAAVALVFFVWSAVSEKAIRDDPAIQGLSSQLEDGADEVDGLKQQQAAAAAQRAAIIENQNRILDALIND